MLGCSSRRKWRECMVWLPGGGRLGWLGLCETVNVQDKRGLWRSSMSDVVEGASVELLPAAVSFVCDYVCLCRRSRCYDPNKSSHPVQASAGLWLHLLYKVAENSHEFPKSRCLKTSSVRKSANLDLILIWDNAGTTKFVFFFHFNKMLIFSFLVSWAPQ